jgi:hypothetical protein
MQTLINIDIKNQDKEKITFLDPSEFETLKYRYGRFNKKNRQNKKVLFHCLFFDRQDQRILTDTDSDGVVSLGLSDYVLTPVGDTFTIYQALAQTHRYLLSKVIASDQTLSHDLNFKDIFNTSNFGLCLDPSDPQEEDNFIIFCNFGIDSNNVVLRSKSTYVWRTLDEVNRMASSKTNKFTNRSRIILSVLNKS